MSCTLCIMHVFCSTGCSTTSVSLLYFWLCFVSLTQCTIGVPAGPIVQHVLVENLQSRLAQLFLCFFFFFYFLCLWLSYHFSLSLIYIFSSLGVQPITLCPPNSGLNCGDAGTCVIDPVSKNEKCTCEAGWSGPTCDTEVDFCITRGCGVGKCTNTNGWFTCDCPEGYKPETQCGPAYDACFDEPCVHGNCSLPVPHLDMSYICTCEKGNME